MGADSIINDEREEWRGHDAEPEDPPTWDDLVDPLCLCGHEVADHWSGVPSSACDIDGCPCDEYRSTQDRIWYI